MVELQLGHLLIWATTKGRKPGVHPNTVCLIRCIQLYVCYVLVLGCKVQINRSGELRGGEEGFGACGSRGGGGP